MPWLSLLPLILAQDESGSPSAEAAPVEAPVQEYALGPGDVISVKVYDEPRLSGDFPVREDGRIEYPLLGDVAVEGLTTAEAARAIRDGLAQDYLVDPQVSASIKAYGSQKVRVLGEVTKPGLYVLRGDTTLSQVLAESGGVKNEAVSEIRITRGDQVIVVQYIDLTRPGGDIVVRGGDQVYVAEAKVIYVNGEVSEPGPVPFRTGMTLTQAISEAGGLGEYPVLRKVTVTREGGRIEVNLKRIQKGRDPDVELLPGDQVFVDRRG